MSTETMGVAMGWARQSYDLPYGSLRENFEIAVLDVLGVSSYFGAIQGRALQKIDPEIISFGSSTPIEKEQLNKALASKGFKKLENAARALGFAVELKADERRAMPSPYLTLGFKRLASGEQSLALPAPQQQPLQQTLLLGSPEAFR